MLLRLLLLLLLIAIKRLLLLLLLLFQLIVLFMKCSCTCLDVVVLLRVFLERLVDVVAIGKVVYAADGSLGLAVFVVAAVAVICTFSVEECC